jgi:hypothetical protein
MDKNSNDKNAKNKIYQKKIYLEKLKFCETKKINKSTENEIENPKKKIQPNQVLFLKMLR